ncbi:MAG: matrixin family metalloprotease [Ferruginibacter sp.]|nr:matrixin family metalloprotease [Ferruginibacter sp.]
MATSKKSKANASAAEIAPRKYCSNPVVPPKVLAAGVSNERAKLILTNISKWVNGTTLHYYFFDKKTDGDNVEYTDGTKEWRSWKGTPAQMDVVRKAFAVWKKLGIGLDFAEVKNREEAEIRIGFMQDDGSWSYVGREILNQKVNERTMNFGWNIAVTDQHNGIDTAVHEIGHTLGLQHEHQNPFAGIVWDEEAVYASLGAPPNNWDRETTFHNIIKKLDKKEVNGSNWDPDSIMHYPFEAGLIKKPVKYEGGLDPAGGLSLNDVKTALEFYPAVNPNKDIVITENISYDIPVKNSEQQNYIFKPTLTKYYTIQTSGKLDTVMVLSEKLAGNQLQYLSGDDNSGTDDNALIKIKLFRGKTYVIKLKVYYKPSKSKTALMVS